MKKKILNEIREYGKVIIVAVFVATLINVLLFTFSQVQQSSMFPTLVEEDMLLVGKLRYLFAEPERGDIVVFIQGEDKNHSMIAKVVRIYTDVYKKIIKEDDQSRLVKRVIALEGEQLDIKDGLVYINGELLDEPYIDVETWASVIEFPLVVPEGQVFVMGDNRQYSKDSRAFGCIDVNSIEGRVVLRLYPFSKFGAVQ